MVKTDAAHIESILTFSLHIGFALNNLPVCISHNATQAWYVYVF